MPLGTALHGHSKSWTLRLSCAAVPSCESDGLALLLACECGSDEAAMLPSCKRESDDAAAGTGTQKTNPRISKAPNCGLLQDLNFFLRTQRSRKRGSCG